MSLIIFRHDSNIVIEKHFITLEQDMGSSWRYCKPLLSAFFMFFCYVFIFNEFYELKVWIIHCKKGLNASTNQSVGNAGVAIAKGASERDEFFEKKNEQMRNPCFLAFFSTSS